MPAVEDRNVAVEYRWAEGQLERLRGISTKYCPSRRMPCPQLVEADISPKRADSRFDPGCVKTSRCAILAI